jgi:hypothetical protein
MPDESVTSGDCTPSLHAHAVGDVAVDGAVQVREEAHGRDALAGERRERLAPRGRPGAVIDGTQVGGEVGGEGRFVREREPLGVLLDEEIEGIDHHHVGHEPHRDLEATDLLGEHDPGEPIAEGILLPVDEVVRGRDVERVRLDGCSGMRRGSQPDDVGRDRDRARELVAGVVLECDFDRHAHSLVHARCGWVTWSTAGLAQQGLAPVDTGR